MTIIQQLRRHAEKACWATSMAVGLLALVAPWSHAVETSQANTPATRPASRLAGSARTNAPRFAQRAPPAPSLKQVISPLIESLLPPRPDAPSEDAPKQHVIPFLEPDPDAKIEVEQHEGLISLVVRDASLRQVVAMVAETQNLNIVFAAPADIGITASFNSIPWKQALDSLLSASGHTWTTSDNIIFVSSLETAAFLPPGSGGRETRIFDLDFASAVDVDQTIKGLLSPGGQSWIQESSSDDNRRSREMVVAFDFPVYLERIAQYVCEADQPPRQVLIEARILQVELDENCKNGINFEAIASFHGNKLNFKTVGFANPAASPAFFLEVTGTALNGLLELLQTTTDAKTLASPRLLVISGQEARIQIGEQLGYRVTTTTQTSSLESVEFLNVGVVLTVTPRITRDGRVMIRIKPEVSTGRVGTITGLPEEETTEVETDILLGDGQGMVIGGLIQEDDSISQSKIPWLGDLPYVGVLFQKRDSNKNRTEIIVALTPHVQPYTPVVYEREAHNLMRTEEPLTTGALNRACRPYEPRLYDALTNPRPLCVERLNEPQPANTEASFLVRLPPVDDESTFHPLVIEPEKIALPILPDNAPKVEEIQ